MKSTAGIYTIPEMAKIGLTEEKAREQGIDCVVGRARYQDTPRGLILGSQRGFLKLVCDRQRGAVLGVHVIGHSATELIQYGMELPEITLVRDEVKLQDQQAKARIVDWPSRIPLRHSPSDAQRGSGATHCRVPTPLSPVRWPEVVSFSLVVGGGGLRPAHLWAARASRMVFRIQHAA